MQENINKQQILNEMAGSTAELDVEGKTKKPSVEISVNDTISKLHQVALSLSQKDGNILIENLAIDDKTNQFKGAGSYLILSRSKDPQNKLDKKEYYKALKTYVEYFAGEEEASKIKEDDLEALQDDSKKNKEKDIDEDEEQREDVSESLIFKYDITNMLFEADETNISADETNISADTSSDKDKNDDGTTSEKVDSPNGYSIAYTIAIPGQKLNDWKDTLKQKSKGLFGGMLADLQNIKIHGRYGTYNVGKIFDPDEWKLKMGKPDIDANTVAGDIDRVFAKDFPQSRGGHTTQVYRTVELIDLLKTQYKVDEEGKQQPVLNEKDITKINKYKYCIVFQLNNKNSSHPSTIYDRLTPKVIAEEITKALGSSEKLVDRNSVNEKEFIIVKDVNTDNKVKAKGAINTDSFYKNKEMTKTEKDTATNDGKIENKSVKESLIFGSDVLEMLMESMEINEADNSSDDKMKKVSEAFDKIIKETIETKYNGYKIFKNKLVGKKELIGEYSDNDEVKNKLDKLDDGIFYYVDTTIDKDKKKKGEEAEASKGDSIEDRDEEESWTSGESLVQKIIGQLIIESDEGESDESEKIKEDLKTQITKKLDEVSFKYTYSLKDIQIIKYTEEAELNESQKLILEGHSREYLEVKDILNNLSAETLSDNSYIDQFREKYKNVINDLRKNGIPSSLGIGQTKKDMQNLLKKDYMKGNSKNPFVKDVISLMRDQKSKEGSISLFDKYFDDGTKKDTSQERIELYALKKALDVFPKEEKKEEDKKKYTIEFYDVNPEKPDDEKEWKMVDSISVDNSEEIKYPEENKLEKHKGYGFTGWEPPIEKFLAKEIEKDEKVKTTYEKLASGNHRVSFIIVNPKTDKEESVGNIYYVNNKKDIDEIEYPKPMDMKSEGFEFEGWSIKEEDLKQKDEITEDTVIKGTYKELPDEEKEDNGEKHILYVVELNEQKDKTQQNIDWKGPYDLYILCRKNIVYKNERAQPKEMRNGNHMKTTSNKSEYKA